MNIKRAFITFTVALMPVVSLAVSPTLLVPPCHAVEVPESRNMLFPIEIQYVAAGKSNVIKLPPKTPVVYTTRTLAQPNVDRQYGAIAVNGPLTIELTLDDTAQNINAESAVFVLYNNRKQEKPETEKEPEKA